MAIKRTSCALFSISGMAAITTPAALPAYASIKSAHKNGEIQNAVRYLFPLSSRSFSAIT